MKMGQMIDSLEGIKAIADREMSVKVALKIKRIVKALTPEATSFEELKNKLIQKHGQEKDGQLQIGPHDAGWAEFRAAYAELLEAEADVKFDALTEVDLEAIASLSIKELMQIDAICA